MRGVILRPAQMGSQLAEEGWAVDDDDDEPSSRDLASLSEAAQVRNARTICSDWVPFG